MHASVLTAHTGISTRGATFGTPASILRPGACDCLNSEDKIMLVTNLCFLSYVHFPSFKEQMKCLPEGRILHIPFTSNQDKNHIMSLTNDMVH